MNEARSIVTSVDAYIAGFPEHIQALLQSVRDTVRAAAPEAEERIAYQMPTYSQHGNLVHFAAFKNHIGFYPAPSGIEAFAQELARYEGAKGSIRFPLDEPLPLDLIRRVVEYRLAENTAKAAAKKKTKK